ncbi:MAG: response regulator [Pseudobdellovibrionaceae bacterium]
MAKVLVVDDNESTQKLINSILYSRGHMTVAVTEPRDALDKLKGEVFDLVISDIMMPGGISEFASIPVIMVTGRRDRRDIERAIQCGADDYVVKPVDPEILISKVNSLLEKNPREKKHLLQALSKPQPNGICQPRSFKSLKPALKFTPYFLFPLVTK